MKIILFVISFLSIFSCNDNVQRQSINNPRHKFDKTKWVKKDNDDYPYREEMLSDLVTNDTLKGLKKEEVIQLLGQPDRSDSNYLFYNVAQQRIGIFPIHTTTLVIKFNKDNIVEWRKIHK